MEDMLLKEESLLEQAPELETAEELEIAPKSSLMISLSGEDISILLTALKEYREFLSENKRNTNKIVIDNAFNEKIDAKIKRADELRFLIKKEVVKVDKDVEIFSIEDEGEVVGVEMFESTANGEVTSVVRPNTVGSTPKLKPAKVVKVATSVQNVSEE